MIDPTAPIASDAVPPERKQGNGDSAVLEDAVLETVVLPESLLLASGEFERVTIIGVGLVGGSIALRMKAMEHGGMLVGCDRQEVLDEAILRGAIDRGVEDVGEAIAGADLIVICTPVDSAIRLLPEVMQKAKAGAVITDTCPTKSQLSEIALSVTSAAHYLGGHPLAGKDRQGIANADANLFENAYWLLTPQEDFPQELRESLTWWVRMLGAYPISLEPNRHDQIVAMTTHVPLVIAIVLSQWISDRAGSEPLLPRLATGHFQSLTALAALPPDMWEGVLRSNKAMVEGALREFRAALDECEERLKSGRILDSWRGAAEFQNKLSRERPGDWDANCEIIVTVSDRPGSIARISSLLAMSHINIRDIGVLFMRERRGGSLRVTVESRVDARRAVEILKEDGFPARLRY